MIFREQRRNQGDLNVQACIALVALIALTPPAAADTINLLCGFYYVIIDTAEKSIAIKSPTLDPAIGGGRLLHLLIGGVSAAELIKRAARGRRRDLAIFYSDRDIGRRVLVGDIELGDLDRQAEARNVGEKSPQQRL